MKQSKVLLPHWTNRVRKTYLIYLAQLKSSTHRSWVELRILCTFSYSGVRFQTSTWSYSWSVTPNIVLGICYVNKNDMSSKVLARIWPQHKFGAKIKVEFVTHDINLSNFEFSVEKKNRKGAFPSCLLPLCQNESECETMHMKRSLICIKMNR